MLVNGLLMTNGIPTFDVNKPEKSIIGIANKVNIASYMVPKQTWVKDKI